MSKRVELGDTLFIVVRKQKLIFLHYIHPVLALIYPWYSVSQNISLECWFVTVNYVVHSSMYSYYAERRNNEFTNDANDPWFLSAFTLLNQNYLAPIMKFQ